ncbi:hypothetical protein VKT23_018173 [Stygiomarasmius scandens]|uniref:Uncharacterized protein n=1 Tax=Marasmiellus scandens TaxID=2682957 RepID=A0ABR1IS91_9AGAR
MASMHMKFMLIFYKSGCLRVAVTTANLVDYDWKDIENAAWVQDVTTLTSSPNAKSDTKSSESFQHVFNRVLDGLNVQPALDIMRKQGVSSHPFLRYFFSEALLIAPLSSPTQHLGPRTSLGLVPGQSLPRTFHVREARRLACRSRKRPYKTHESHPKHGLSDRYQFISLPNQILIRVLIFAKEDKSPSLSNTSHLQQASTPLHGSTSFFYSARGESPEDWPGLDLKLTRKGVTKMRWSQAT